MTDKSPIERVCVIGAGAIGGLFAAHLAQLVDVSVLTRRGRQAHALNEQGLRISGKSNITARVTAAADPADLPDFDLGIVATKATQLEGVAAGLEGRFPGATLMTIQNGLGAEEVLRAHGGWPLITGTTFMGGVRHSDTHIEYELDMATWIAPYADESTTLEQVQQVRDLLVEAGLEAEAFADLRPAQWSKLIFTASIGTVSALTELPHVRAFAEVDRPTDLGRLVRDLVDEGKRIAAAAGIELHEDPWEMNVNAVVRGETATAGEGEYAHPPSILVDVRARRRTEVDFFTGALVREAERLGVPAPLHTALYRLELAKESGW